MGGDEVLDDRLAVRLPFLKNEAIDFIDEHRLIVGLLTAELLGQETVELLAIATRHRERDDLLLQIPDCRETPFVNRHSIISSAERDRVES